MSKSTKQTQEAQERTRMNAELSQSNSNYSDGGQKPPQGELPLLGGDEEPINRKPIEATPFHMIGNNKLGWFIALGKYRLTEPMETEVLAMELIEHTNYNLIFRMMVTLMEEGKSLPQQ